MPINEQARNRWSLISLKDFDGVTNRVFVGEPITKVTTKAVGGIATKGVTGKVTRTAEQTTFTRAAPTEFATFKIRHALAVEDVFEFTYVPETLEISYEAKYKKGEAAQDAFSPSIQYVNNSVMSIQFSAVFHDAGRSGSTESAVVALGELLRFMVPLDRGGTLSKQGAPRRLLLSGPQIPIPFSKLQQKVSAEGVRRTGLIPGVFKTARGPRISNDKFNLDPDKNKRLDINDTLTPVVLTKLDADMSLFSKGAFLPFSNTPGHIEVNLGFLVFVLPMEVIDLAPSARTFTSTTTQTFRTRRN